jgi:hypothetical protein
MLKKIGVVLGAIITMATLMGLGFGVENHFAKEVPTAMSFEAVQQDIQMVATRIDAMKLEDELILVKKKIERLEVRWGDVFYKRFERYWQTTTELKGVMPDDYKLEYQEAIDDKIRLEKEIEAKNKPIKKKGESE